MLYWKLHLSNKVYNVLHFMSILKPLIVSVSNMRLYIDFYQESYTVFWLWFVWIKFNDKIVRLLPEKKFPDILKVHFYSSVSLMFHQTSGEQHKFLSKLDQSPEFPFPWVRIQINQKLSKSLSVMIQVFVVTKPKGKGSQ